MQWRILAIGKPKLSFARAGIEEYLGRIRPYTALETTFLRGGTREAESAALLEQSEHHFRVLLDERGEHIGSRELAAQITRWETGRIKRVAVLVGGADGHSAELRQAADWAWSLSKLTMQHELALLVALEQLYRAYTIKAGSPYHRD